MTSTVLFQTWPWRDPALHEAVMISPNFIFQLLSY